MRVTGTFETAKQVENIKPPAKGREWHKDKRTSGLYIAVSANGYRVWYGQLKVNGKAKMYPLGAYHPKEGVSLKVARETLDAARERVQAGSDPFPDESSKHFPAVWKRFNRAHIQTLAEGTQQNYRTLRNHIGNRWDDVTMADANLAHLQDDAEALLLDIRDNAAERRQGSTGQAAYNNNLSYLKKFFRSCRDSKLFSADWPLSRTKIGEQAVRKRVLQGPELTAIWNAAGQENYPTRQLVRFAMLVPVRIWSEAGMIRREEVNDGEWCYEVPKTEVEQVLELPPMALDVLEECPDMGPLYFRAAVSKGSQVALKKRLDKRIEVDDWTFHDLRTAFMTHLRDLGAPFELVDEVCRPVDNSSAGRKHYDFSERAEEKGELLRYWEYALRSFADGKRPYTRKLERRNVAFDPANHFKRWREWLRGADVVQLERSA